jgi:colanic acid/amylovoran biosynthesis glycosyltransferase
MRIVYLIPEFPTQTHTFFWREIRALRDQGVEIHLTSTRRPTLTCEHSWAPEAARETTYLLPLNPLSLLPIALFPKGSIRAFRYSVSLGESSPKQRLILGSASYLAARKLNALCRRIGADHVHVHSCANSAHIAALGRQMGGHPYSLTLHGDMDVYGKNHVNKMTGAAFVSVVTRPLQSEVHSRVGLPLDRLPVISMGVDTAAFQPGPTREAIAGRLELLTVARLHRNKGHTYALAAMRSLVDRGLDLHYTIAGDGPDRNLIEEKVRELGLGSRVKLTGSIGEQQVLEQLRSADAFVLSSIGMGEAAPVSVMEAMSCGVPVICSMIGGTADMISDGVDGFMVAQSDEAGLASAIERLATDVALRRRISVAARARALRDFDYRPLAQRLLDEIRQRLPGPAVVGSGSFQATSGLGAPDATPKAGQNRV